MEMFYWDETAQDYLPVSGPDGTIKVSIEGMQQVDIGGHNMKSVPAQTSALVAPTTGTNLSATWIDTMLDGGYINVAYTQKSNVSGKAKLSLIWSHDQVAIDNVEPLDDGTTAKQYRQGETGVKARWLKIQFDNIDAAAQTVSTWAFLKA
jgi:hypothetical protein